MAWVALACAAYAATGCQKEVIPPGAFVVLLDTHPKGLDPRFAVNDASAKLIGLLHAGLVSLDTKNGEPELELAESVEQTSPTTYEVRLRAGLTFHDGTPLTSADVEYTYTQLNSEKVKSPLAGLSKRIKTFEVRSETEFMIELFEPRAPFIQDLGMGIVPKHYCEPEGTCPDPPIGAGPFRFVSSEGRGTFVFGPFDAYVGGRPDLERLAFRVVKDDNSRLIALIGGAADLVQNAVSPLMLPVVEREDDLDVVTTDSFKYTYLQFNLRREPFKDVRVRRAIAHALDRESIVRHKYRGLATLSTGMLSPTHWAYTGDVQTYDYDVERAKELLDEAGYEDPDGDGPEPRFTVELKVSSLKFRRSLAALMANQLSRVGIEVRVRSYEWGTYFNDIRKGNFDMTTLQWPSVLEPSLYHWAFHSSNIPTPDRLSAGANRSAYVNEELDVLLDQGMIEADRNKRREIYVEVQKVLARDLPYVSLWHEHNIAVLSKGTTGYWTTPNARFEALKVTKREERP